MTRRSPKADRHPSPVTADDLIARVEARPSYRVRVVLRYLTGRPLRRYPPPSSAPAAGAILVAGILCFVGIAWHVTSQPAPPPQSPSEGKRPLPLTLPPAEAGDASARRLEGLATAAETTGVAQARTTTRVQAWQADMPGHPDGYLAHDEQRRFDADGTVHLQITPLGPQRDGHLIALPPGDAQIEETSLSHPPGFPYLIGEIAVELGKEPAQLLWAAAQAHRTENLSPAQLAAIYRVLAISPKVIAHGPMPDRFGRAGLAFTFTHDRLQDLIVADPGTGQLLSFERSEVSDPASPLCLAYLIFFSSP